MKEIYIYVLIDPETKHIRYVGKTTNIKRRLSAHISRSKNKKYHSASWIKSLIDKTLLPILEIIEIVNDENWENREQYWIAYYREQYDLTNILDGGEGGATYGSLGKKKTPEQIERTKKSRTGLSIKQTDKKGLRRKAIIDFNKKREKPILQYDLDGKFIKEWNSAVDCGKELEFNHSNITSCCKGIRDVAHSYMWRFKTDNIEMEILPYTKDEHHSNKKIFQYDNQGSLIREYSSIKQASEITNILRTSIGNCLRNKTKTAGGFKWKYN